MEKKEEEARPMTAWENRLLSLAIAATCWAIMRPILFALKTGSFGSNVLALLGAFFIYHWVTEQSFYKAVVKIASWVGLIKFRLEEQRPQTYVEIGRRSRVIDLEDEGRTHFPDDGVGKDIEDWEKQRRRGLLDSIGQGLLSSIQADISKRVYERRTGYLKAKKDYYKAGREYTEERLKAQIEELLDLKEGLDHERKMRKGKRGYDLDIEIKKKELELAKLMKQLQEVTEPIQDPSRSEWLQAEFEAMINDEKLKAEKEWELQAAIGEVGEQLKSKYPGHESEIEDFIHQKKMAARIKLSRESDREDW